jgi:hypothetical protein
MGTSIPSRPLAALTPQSSSSPGTLVRVAANSFIPWSWVEFPDPPPVTLPILVGGAALDFFVHGDGRMPASRSDAVGTGFRTQGVVEVDVVERPGETFAVLARNQPSKSELRGPFGVVLHTETGRGPLTSKFSASRLAPNTVHLLFEVSGSVPWNVAGPQPAIDLKYSVQLDYDPAMNRLHWSMSAVHDGFPGHEVFLESAGGVRFKKSYLPSFFSVPGTGTARPTIPQAVDGARALGGAIHAQHWSQRGYFTP